MLESISGMTVECRTSSSAFVLSCVFKVEVLVIAARRIACCNALTLGSLIEPRQGTVAWPTPWGRARNNVLEVDALGGSRGIVHVDLRKHKCDQIEN
jgi:hypothetical protein